MKLQLTSLSHYMSFMSHGNDITLLVLIFADFVGKTSNQHRYHDILKMCVLFIRGFRVAKNTGLDASSFKQFLRPSAGQKS